MGRGKREPEERRDHKRRVVLVTRMAIDVEFWPGRLGSFCTSLLLTIPRSTSGCPIRSIINGRNKDARDQRFPSLARASQPSESKSNKD
jgi:hypothetical protein